MQRITVIATGTLSEAHWRDAAAEYIKRLSGVCGFTQVQLKEEKLPQNPSAAEIAHALDAEAEAILRTVPKKATVIALCIEGKELSSPALAGLFSDVSQSAKPELCFIIGSSYGLSDKVKCIADVKLSMSQMTFPHQLARVMLYEAIYRALDISRGGRYHK